MRTFATVHGIAYVGAARHWTNTDTGEVSMVKLRVCAGNDKRQAWIDLYAWKRLAGWLVDANISKGDAVSFSGQLVDGKDRDGKVRPEVHLSECWKLPIQRKGERDAG